MMPIAIALSSGCMIWNILLNPNQGVVNSILMMFGIPAQAFFTSTKRSMFVFVSNTVANLLMFVPMYMITLGGPEMSTNLMMYEAYKSGFIYADFGRSYAIITLILLVSFAVVMAEMKVLKPKH